MSQRHKPTLTDDELLALPVAEQRACVLRTMLTAYAAQRCAADTMAHEPPGSWWWQRAADDQRHAAYVIAASRDMLGRIEAA